jgi:hypothetical protein
VPSRHLYAMAAHGKASETKNSVKLTRICRNIQSEARLTGRANEAFEGIST